MRLRSVLLAVFTSSGWAQTIEISTFTAILSSSFPESSSAPITPVSCNTNGPLDQPGIITSTWGYYPGYPWTGACSDYVSMVQSSWSVWNSKQHSTWSYPDFVMPQSNTQACNIFGAICQTGSITVDVNISSTISATEVDCSYYLTAQSYSNRGVTTRPYISTTIMYPWQHAFGQSPECSSFVAMEKPQRVSLSRCENPSSGYTDWDDYIPPGTRVLDSAGWDFFDCCGRCNFFAEEVRILYFPAANSTCTPSVSTNETTTSTISEPARLRFRQVDNAEGSIAIYSGVTLTSPSMYIEVVGTAGVSDSCGLIDPITTNPIVALAPGQLTTLSVTGVKDGDVFTKSMREYLRSGLTWKAVGPDDLACPTFGLQDRTIVTVVTITGWTSNPQNGSFMTTSISTSVNNRFGPPYNPIVLPPDPLVSAHPAWRSRCTFIGNGWDRLVATFGVFDPPIALQKQAPVIVPPSTTPTGDPPTTSTPASPSHHPSGFSPSTRPPLSNNPSPTAIPGHEGNGPGSGAPPSGAPPGQGQNQGPGDPPSDPPGNSPSNPITVSIPPNSPPLVIDDTTLSPGGPAVTSDGVAYTIDPAGNLVKIPDRTAGPKPTAVDINGQRVTIAPVLPGVGAASGGGVVVDGTTFQPGASGTIDGGATVSVGSDGGSVVIGDGGITTTVYVPGGDPTGSSTPIGSGGSRNKRKHFGTMLFLLTFFLVY